MCSTSALGVSSAFGLLFLLGDISVSWGDVMGSTLIPYVDILQVFGACPGSISSVGALCEMLWGPPWLHLGDVLVLYGGV